jgi:hypothetical protein
MEADVQSWLMICATLVNVVVVVLTYRQTTRTHNSVRAVAADVNKVEIATNSMMAAAKKLALEKATADASRAHAAGVAEGVAQASDNT